MNQEKLARLQAEVRIGGKVGFTNIYPPSPHFISILMLSDRKRSVLKNAVTNPNLTLGFFQLSVTSRSEFGIQHLPGLSS